MDRSATLEKQIEVLREKIRDLNSHTAEVLSAAAEVNRLEQKLLYS